MRLILYKSSSELIRCDKINYLSKTLEVQGFLRESTSINNPQILIELDYEMSDIVDDNDDEVDNVIYFKQGELLSANYVYIPDFNRYYYISDITSVRTKLWRLSLDVDVLMSHLAKIKNVNALVTRNEFTYDKLVKDDLVTYYYNKEVTESTLPKGDKVNTYFHSSLSLVTDNIVITCVNDDTPLNTSIINPPDESLPQVSPNVTGDNQTYRTYTTFSASLNTLSERILANDNLATYIFSIVAFPFALDKVSGDPHTLKLGNTTLSDVYVGDLRYNMSKYHVIADFTITGDNFTDYEPYTRYEIYIPYLSWVTLNADDILNNRIIVYYVVNHQTGNSQVSIYDVTNSKLLYTSNCQLGVSIPVTSTNAREVSDTRNSNNIGLGVGLLTSTLTTIGGFATGNPLAVGGGAISMGSTISKYIQNENTNYQRASGSVSSGQSGAYLPQDVRIRKTKYIPKDYNDEYFKLNGRPLNKVVRLGDLKGYTIVGDAHLEDFTSATKQELDEIKLLLTQGVIL